MSSLKRFWCACALLAVFSSVAITRPQNSAANQCSAEYKPVAGQSSVTVSFEPSQSLVRETVDVAAHQSLSYNFELTKGTTLVARFQVTGLANNKIKILLLDADNFQRYQAGQQYNYFQGTTGEIRNIAHYVFHVPLDNTYYLILDNSEAWLLPRSVNLYVYGLLPAKSSEILTSEQTMTEEFSQLGQLFIFPAFKIEVKHCGVVNAFSNPDITVCTELAETLHDQNMDQVVVFVVFHELGHTLLRQWGYPLWDNEDAADEFATVIMILAKQQQSARQAAQWWASQTSQQEALSKLWIDDRHSISPQRARNVIHWLNQQNDLLDRWFHLFAPNMQTSALIGVLNDTEVPFNKEILRTELRKRGCTQ